MASYLPALGELLQASQPSAGIARGGAALGDLLGGGPQARAEANYPIYLKNAAGGAEALDKAVITRLQRMAREHLDAAVAEDPSFAGHVPLGQAVLGMAEGQPNLSTYGAGMKDLGDIELRNRELDAIQKGDLKGAQAFGAVLKDKVLPELGADGKMVFTPLADDPAQLTPLGTAEIGSKTAQAGAYDAAAGEHAAQARAADALAHTRTPGDPLYDSQVGAHNRAGRGHGGAGDLNAAIAQAMDPGHSALGDVFRDVMGQLGGQTAPGPLGAPSAGHAPPADTLAKARAAITAGADPAKVKSRLKAAGYDTSGL